MTLVDTDRSMSHAVSPVVPPHGALRPLGIGEVEITGGFWADRQRVNALNTLPHIEHWLEKEGWLGNFDAIAAGSLSAATRRGREFADSEVYKYLEAVAWQLGRTSDPALEKRFTDIVARVAAAQDEDGYLNTAFGRADLPPRWSDLEWGHELYCAGHLFQAAVARARTTPDETEGLLNIARRVADLICREFGPDGRQSVCGHPEIETALIELGRVTGDARYGSQARLFVERRGHGVLRDIEWGRSYYQDEVPVREAEVLHGHAVRANYLAAGAVDVAVETGDAPLLDVMGRQWAATVAKRTYITGGQGSHHQDEAFGDDFELPPDRAYSETCAGIASIQFTWRMLLAQGESRYADLIERTLFNVVATSPSADGRAFYYANTLHRRSPGEPADPQVVSPRAEASLRAPWFEVSCCPPNIARTLASLESYVATANDDGIQLHQYAHGRIATTLGSGEAIELAVETAYPADGRVTVRVLTDAEQEWTLSLRVPTWATGATVSIGDESHDVPPGVAIVRRVFRSGDTVVLDLPLAPRFTYPDARIDAVRGSVAVERGPVVFALESTDLPAGWDDLADTVVDPRHPPQEDNGSVSIHLSRRRPSIATWPYAEDGPTTVETAPATVALIPYHSWAERGPSTMRVWMPVT